MIYDANTTFFVTFAIHTRENVYSDFKLTEMSNDIFGLYGTFTDNPDREDGEVASELLGMLEDIYGDGMEFKKITLINFWPIIPKQK